MLIVIFLMLLFVRVLRLFMVVILDGELFGHWGLVGIFTMRSFWREIIG